MRVDEIHIGDIVQTTLCGGKARMVVEVIQEDLERGADLVIGHRWLRSNRIGKRRLIARAEEVTELVTDDAT